MAAAHGEGVPVPAPHARSRSRPRSGQGHRRPGAPPGEGHAAPGLRSPPPPRESRQGPAGEGPCRAVLSRAGPRPLPQPPPAAAELGRGLLPQPPCSGGEFWALPRAPSCPAAGGCWAGAPSCSQLLGLGCYYCTGALCLPSSRCGWQSPEGWQRSVVQGQGVCVGLAWWGQGLWTCGGGRALQWGAQG